MSRYAEVIELLIRVTLSVGVGLLAAGTQIAPHDHTPGWTHEGLNHPPAAVHATLLEHLRYLLSQEREKARPAPSGTVVESAPLAVAVSTVVFAFFGFGTPRVWRPGRLGLERLVLPLVAAQYSFAPLLAPPRAASPS